MKIEYNGQYLKVSINNEFIKKELHYGLYETELSHYFYFLDEIINQGGDIKYTNIDSFLSVYNNDFMQAHRTTYKVKPLIEGNKITTIVVKNN